MHIDDLSRVARQRRDAATDEARRIVGFARAEGRTHLTAAEDARVNALLGTRAAAGRELAQWDQVAAGEAQGLARSSERHAVALPGRGENRASDARFTIGHQRRTYEPDTDPKGTGFLRDVGLNFLRNDPGASQRLGQHQHEFAVDNPDLAQRANAGTGNFAGLVVPQYLTDMYAPIARAMRPFADICNHHDLPAEGMTVNIPLLTTGMSVALQTSENSAGSSTAPNDTLLTENVQTSTGNATISRQAIDRGTGIDEVVMQDLFRALASNVDSTLITQATTGLAALAQNGAGPLNSGLTIATLYSKLVGAANGVEQALLGLARPSHVLLAPVRFWWASAQFGNTWPVINVGGQQLPWQAGLIDASKGYDTGPRGFLPAGLDLIVDANIPVNGGASTNQDALYVVPQDECHLWEDPAAPVYIRAEQPAAASLGVLMVIYEYYAYSFRRYTNAMQSVIGSALITPTF